MQKVPSSLVWVTLLLMLLISCQREVHFLPSAPEFIQNELQRGFDNQCQPIQVAGTYLQNTTLGDTHFLEIAVLVKNLDAYTITTNALNGYSFEASGTFADTGFVRVRLFGTGKPLAAEVDTFVITLGQTSCTALVSVIPPFVPPTAFNLLGAPETCLDATVNGGYVKNAALPFSSYVELRAEVNATGPYSVSTDTVNGYYFSGTGHFTATGRQTLLLYAHGTPQKEGEDVFRILDGQTTCTFLVSVSPKYEVASGSDYFPLTLGSHWNYIDLKNSGSAATYIVKRMVTDTLTVNKNVYTIVTEENPAEGAKQHLFRKKENDYFEYTRVDQYNAAVSYTDQVTDEVLFLKTGVGKGTTWESKEFRGTILGGQSIILKYFFACLSTGEITTLGGKTYTDVIKIRMTPMLRPLNQDFSYAGEFTDWYYAKGIGLIYTATVVTNFTRRQWVLESYQVP